MHSSIENNDKQQARRALCERTLTTGMQGIQKHDQMHDINYTKRYPPTRLMLQCGLFSNNQPGQFPVRPSVKLTMTSFGPQREHHPVCGYLFLVSYKPQLKFTSVWLVQAYSHSSQLFEVKSPYREFHTDVCPVQQRHSAGYDRFGVPSCRDVCGGALGLSQPGLLGVLSDGAPPQRPAQETQHGGRRRRRQGREATVPVEHRQKGIYRPCTPATFLKMME